MPTITGVLQANDSKTTLPKFSVFEKMGDVEFIYESIMPEMDFVKDDNDDGDDDEREEFVGSAGYGGEGYDSGDFDRDMNDLAERIKKSYTYYVEGLSLCFCHLDSFFRDMEIREDIK